MSRFALLMIVALWLAADGAGQSRLYRLVGDAALDREGAAVCGAGDLDGDGFADILSAAPGHLGGTGRLRGFSGRDGKRLFEVTGDATEDSFGWSVASIGDVDRDGVPDFAVSAPQLFAFPPDKGYVRVYSGKTRQVLHKVLGGAAGDGFGISVAAAGDVDKDGVPDWIVGAHGEDTVADLAGQARIYSGKDASVLRSFYGQARRDFFGYAVAGAGDLDKDGYADVIVGAPDVDATVGQNVLLDAGRAYVFSGKDGTTLFTKDGDGVGDTFGHAVAGAGDVDGDGWLDFAVGATEYWDLTTRDKGYVRVHSGKDGSLLHTLRGDGVGDYFGDPIAGGIDLDADGRADLLVGAHKSSAGGPSSGLVRAYSGKDATVLLTLTGAPGDQLGFSLALAGNVDRVAPDDLLIGVPEVEKGQCLAVSARRLALSADVYSLDVVTGGQQKLTLCAPSSEKTRFYHVLGSMTGVDYAVGIDFGNGVKLPLEYDPYMLFTVTNANTVILDSLGRLDDQAKGQATFNLPRGFLALRGKRFDHAFLVYDLDKLRVSFASNARPLCLD